LLSETRTITPYSGSPSKVCQPLHSIRVKSGQTAIQLNHPQMARAYSCLTLSVPQIGYRAAKARWPKTAVATTEPCVHRRTIMPHEHTTYTVTRHNSR